MKISVLQPSGEIMVVEVTPEMTGRELKQRIKEGQPSWDELTRRTTGVEIIFEGTKLLANDAKLLDTGIAADPVVSVVFKPNVVTCANQDVFAGLRRAIDWDLLLVVEIPSDETQIPEEAFIGCEKLAKVIIPNSVTHIRDGAFEGCSSLVNLTIPDSVTHIGNYAFECCRSLLNLAIPSSVTHIGVGAFENCSSLVTLTIPESVTHIGPLAFQNCSSLVNLTLPHDVTYIGDNAFQGCSSLDFPPSAT